MRKLRRATYEEMLRGEIDQLSAMNEPTLRLVEIVNDQEEILAIKNEAKEALRNLEGKEPTDGKMGNR
jgi:hypothetical protein